MAKSKSSRLLAWLSALRALVLKPIAFAERVCFWIGFVFCSLCSVAGLFAVWTWMQLPRIDQMQYLELKAQAHRVIQRKIQKANSMRTQPLAVPQWLELGRISRSYLFAVVLSEDAGFFEHTGLDLNAMRLSLAENIRLGSYDFGASTLSQQVVKNLYLSSEKSLIRKLKEAILVKELERRFSKNEILELYVNLVETGPDLYGLGPAARKYFGKEAAAISSVEGVWIAQLIPSPRRRYVALYENAFIPREIKRRMRRVLGDLLAQELISESQYRKAVQSIQRGIEVKRPQIE